MARSQCAGCGTRVRGKRLCQTCEVTDSYGEGIDEQEESDTDETLSETLEYECTACGNEYNWDGSGPCPECGARSRRYIGPLEGTA